LLADFLPSKVSLSLMVAQLHGGKDLIFGAIATRQVISQQLATKSWPLKSGYAQWPEPLLEHKGHG
jgi:hypothetical protein